MHRMLGPRHTDARTIFFVVKNLIGKMTHGRSEQKKFETTKNHSKIYKNFYRSEYLKQADNGIIFRENL